jgi:NAD(P)H-hydrate repair Nnr-like enzyme with NAD(P)H-hydrate dehydratase domain
MRCGIGMIRYLGPQKVGHLLLEVRPEAVLGLGRADVWVLGSGISADHDPDATEMLDVLTQFAAAEIAVADAGALAMVDFSQHAARTVLTPHAGELAELLTRLGHPISRAEVENSGVEAVVLAARLTDCVVLLKGNLTHVATASGELRTLGPLSAQLATAGTGDVLAGILGALLAANKDAVLAGEQVFLDVIELAVELHSLAAELAHKDGPVSALDVAESVRKVIAELS